MNGIDKLSIGLTKTKTEKQLVGFMWIKFNELLSRKVKEYFPKMSDIKISYHALILESRL